MTNPETPPPSPGGAVPPQPPADGSATPPATEGLGSPPPAVEGVGDRPRSRRAGVVAWIGGLLVALVVALGIFGVRSWMSRDQAQDAKVGDCIAAGTAAAGSQQQTDAKVVDCGADDAAYRVVGRVENDTDTNSRACDGYFTEQNVEYAVFSSTSGDGYLLCLRKS